MIKVFIKYACGVTANCDTVLDVYWTEGEIEKAVRSTSSLICTDSSLLADNRLQSTIM